MSAFRGLGLRFSMWIENLGPSLGFWDSGLGKLRTLWQWGPGMRYLVRV